MCLNSYLCLHHKCSQKVDEPAFQLVLLVSVESEVQLTPWNTKKPFTYNGSFILIALIKPTFA